MAENKANTDVLTTTDGDDVTRKNNGESLCAKSLRAQSSPSSLVEDSGTESGEDLRLLNPELLAEVRGALSKLESALPTLDTARRASIIPLVTKLQSCLKVSENHSASSLGTSTLPGKRSSKHRKERHTVGVSEEELANARKWLEENFLEDEETSNENSTGSLSMKYESAPKKYKPVKFTPAPREHRHSLDLCKYDIVREPEPHELIVDDSPKPLFAFRTYIDPQFHHKQMMENCSSDEGDVSSTEEESMKVDVVPKHHENNTKRIPARFQKNCKKMRMKRANTIDIPKLGTCENFVSSGDESIYKSADELQALGRGFDDESRSNTLERKAPPPKLEVKTENDKKFAKFLEKIKEDDLQSKTVTYNPNAAGGAQWSNRFSYIKTAFEQGQPESTCPVSDPSKFFKPIRKTASFPKRAPGPPTSTENNFKHALKSPFKPVTKAVANIYNSFKSNNNSEQARFASNANNLRTPKTYYTPVSAPRKQNNNTNNYNTYPHNGYHSDGKTNYYIDHAGSSVPRIHYYVERPAASHYAYPPNPNRNLKPEYFLNEPSAYLHVPGYRVQPVSSQPVSPTLPTMVSTSPIYQEYNPYMSLPPSPLLSRADPSRMHPKPLGEFYEEQPAHSKIMGKPQQAVVVNRNQPEAPPPLPVKSNFVRDLSKRSAEPKNSSTYQKLAEKSPVLQNFAQNSRAPAKSVEVKPCVPPTLKVSNERPVPPVPKKQVKIVEDEEDMPEQFFVLNQRNKFETLSTNPSSGSTQHLPPQINEKAFFKPVSNTKKRASPPVVAQERSPPQSPVQMPSVLQKSESWHQMIMERMKQAKPPSPIKPKIPRAKSTHNLATLPKQYEATLSPETLNVKKQTVEQFLMRDKQRQRSTSPNKAPSPSTGSFKAVSKLNEDFKHVDEAFELLFNEASCARTT